MPAIKRFDCSHKIFFPARNRENVIPMAMPRGEHLTEQMWTWLELVRCHQMGGNDKFTFS